MHGQYLTVSDDLLLRRSLARAGAETQVTSTAHADPARLPEAACISSRASSRETQVYKFKMISPRAEVATRSVHSTGAVREPWSLAL